MRCSICKKEGYELNHVARLKGIGKICLDCFMLIEKNDIRTLDEFNKKQ